MKKIITHINPDLDAVTGVWLIKKFLPEWEDAGIDFISATPTGEKMPDVDKDPQVLYIDVGRGKLDHHQTKKYLSATKLCWQYILKKRKSQPLSSLDLKAGEKLVEIVTQVDNAYDIHWQESQEFRYCFYFHNIIDGLRGLSWSDREVVDFSFCALEAIFLQIKNKIKAQEEIEKGEEFETCWGKALAVESSNKQVIWEGEVKGYVLVVKKDPESGKVQIYARPDSKVDLTQIYQKIKKIDPDSDWFLHSSKRLLLNHSSVNPNMRPTKLTSEQIIRLLKKQKI
ncbi:MAG: hypothetical protein ACPLKP_00165 [Microgenomates group bacterium]